MGATPPPPGLHTMQCMEVWGGSGVVQTGVSMPGIDAWVLSRPFEGAEAGGDVHYVSSCGTGRISRILLADISGHGAAVADLAITLRSLMRRYVNYVDQGRFVERLNAEFAGLTQMGLFATAAIATYFAPSATLSISNAGHPRPLLYNDRTKSWRLLLEEAPHDPGAVINLPLGLLDDAAYPPVHLRALPGDLAIFYSDSLIEAPLGGGRLLGQDGLLELARTLDTASPETITTQLYQRVLERSGGASLGDDVTILAVRPSGRAEQVGILHRLGAQVRFLGLAAKSLLPGQPAAPWPEFSRENIAGELIPALARDYGRNAPEI